MVPQEKCSLSYVKNPSLAKLVWSRWRIFFCALVDNDYAPVHKNVTKNLANIKSHACSITHMDIPYKDVIICNFFCNLLLYFVFPTLRKVLTSLNVSVCFSWNWNLEALVLEERGKPECKELQ